MKRRTGWKPIPREQTTWDRLLACPLSGERKVGTDGDFRSDVMKKVTGGEPEAPESRWERE
jgi:hypothetical protein